MLSIKEFFEEMARLSTGTELLLSPEGKTCLWGSTYRHLGISEKLLLDEGAITIHVSDCWDPSPGIIFPTVGASDWDKGNKQTAIERATAWIDENFGSIQGFKENLDWWFD